MQKAGVKASFFLTGNFYDNPVYKNLIHGLHKDGHYLGAHSDKHLLYGDWNKRDSLLVSKQQFDEDLQNNYRKMAQFGIGKKEAHYFLPPFEWYNDTIAAWTKAAGLQLINYSPGTRSNADYTTPQMKAYRGSAEIYQSIINKAINGAPGSLQSQGVRGTASGLNGFILLLHIGTDPARTDKMYRYLPRLLQVLKAWGYKAVTIDQLLQNAD